MASAGTGQGQCAYTKAPAHQLCLSMPASQKVLRTLVATCQCAPERHSLPARAQAKDSALAAARAEAAAANNALKTVETGINYYAMRKEYLKLKDIAEASDVAGKVIWPPAPTGSGLFALQLRIWRSMRVA